MTIKNLNTIEAIEVFLQGNQSVVFSVLGDKTERYNFICVVIAVPLTLYIIWLSRYLTPACTTIYRGRHGLPSVSEPRCEHIHVRSDAASMRHTVTATLANS